MDLRAMVRLSLLFALAPTGVGLAADGGTSEIVRGVAAMQTRLPWFWSPPIEGLADIPYTYEMKQLKRRQDRRGKAMPLAKDGGGRSKQAGTLHMERIALAGGSYYRCLMQDGISPCSPDLVQALERDSQKRESFTPEEKARIAGIGEERRRRRRAFWSEFPGAFRFEQSGPNQIRFIPTGNYQPLREPSTVMLAGIRGQFWFDPTTYEITRMEYELLADADNPLVRLAKGDTFNVEMAKLVDDRYLPLRVSIRRKLPGGRGTEDTLLELSNFRRFAVESEIRFVDPEEPDKPARH